MYDTIPCETCLTLPKCTVRICRDNCFIMSDHIINYMKKIKCEALIKFTGYIEIPLGDYREFYYDRIVAIAEFFQNKIDLKERQYKVHY